MVAPRYVKDNSRPVGQSGVAEPAGCELRAASSGNRFARSPQLEAHKETLVRDAPKAENEAFFRRRFLSDRKYRQRGYQDSGAGPKREEFGEAGGRQKREYVRAAADQHAGNKDRLPLCRMRRAAAESHGSGRAMPEVRVRSARLQTVRTLRPVQPLRMQSADSRQNLSQRQAQRLLALFHPRDGRKGNFQQRQSASE